MVNDETLQIEDYIKTVTATPKEEDVYLLIDRLVVEHTQTAISRLNDSIETAFSKRNGICILKVFGNNGNELLLFLKEI